MSLHSSSSVNGEGSTPKDPLYKILDELRSLKLWKEKQERKEKGKAWEKGKSCHVLTSSYQKRIKLTKMHLAQNAQIVATKTRHPMD